VALVLEHNEAAAGGAAKSEGAGAKPPEGYGSLPQEALVRSIITNALTDQPAQRFIRAASRTELQARIKKELEEKTDVAAKGVLFTDIAVQ
jgi:flagellar FliL protein